MEPAPKGDRANVRVLKKKAGAGPAFGRGDSAGYDPSTGETHGSKYRSSSRDSDAESDVFALVESKGYNEDRFYCRSVNADGHGEKLSIRVPQGLDSQIHAAVAEVPEYRTPHDLFRDAVVHRLEYLQKRYSLGEEARRVLQLERIRADMERHDNEIDAMKNIVQEIETKLARAWDDEDYGMFARQMEEASETIDWLREPYQRQASTILAKWRAKTRAALAQHRAQVEE